MAVGILPEETVSQGERARGGEGERERGLELINIRTWRMNNGVRFWWFSSWPAWEVDRFEVVML